MCYFHSISVVPRYDRTFENYYRSGNYSTSGHQLVTAAQFAGREKRTSSVRFKWATKRASRSNSLTWVRSEQQHLRHKKRWRRKRFRSPFVVIGIFVAVCAAATAAVAAVVVVVHPTEPSAEPHSSHAELPFGVHTFLEAAIDRPPIDGSIQCAEIEICATEGSSLKRANARNAIVTSRGTTTTTAAAAETAAAASTKQQDTSEGHLKLGPHRTSDYTHTHQDSRPDLRTTYCCATTTVSFWIGGPARTSRFECETPSPSR